MAASDIAVGAARRPARLVGTLLIQLVLCALALEAAARLLDPLGISFYPETAAWLDTLVIEEPIGYRNRPGLEAPSGACRSRSTRRACATRGRRRAARGRVPHPVARRLASCSAWALPPTPRSPTASSSS